MWMFGVFSFANIAEKFKTPNLQDIYQIALTKNSTNSSLLWL